MIDHIQTYLAVLLVQLQPVHTCRRSWKDNVCQTKVARARNALQHNLFMANPVLQVCLSPHIPYYLTFILSAVF